MNQDPVERLLQNLTASVEVYRQLLEVSESKQRHIISQDLAQLRNDLRAEERLLASAQDLNTKRAECHRQAVRAVCGGQAAGTLEALCRFLPREPRARCMRVRQELKDVIVRLQEVNRSNVGLISNGIALVEGLLGALLQVEPAAAYGPSGTRPRPQVPACSLDARA